MYLFKKIEDNSYSFLFHLLLSLILSLIPKHSKDIKFIKIQFLNYSNIFLATKQNNNNKQTQETRKKKKNTVTKISDQIPSRKIPKKLKPSSQKGPKSWKRKKEKKKIFKRVTWRRYRVVNRRPWSSSLTENSSIFPITHYTQMHKTQNPTKKTKKTVILMPLFFSFL